MSKFSFFINGKWLSQEMTGTQRFSFEITKRLLSLRSDSVLVAPNNATIPSWINQEQVIQGRLSGQLFEQLELPLIALRGRIINLVGSSPLLARNQITAIHDASVLRYPETFSKGFAIWYWILLKTANFRNILMITVSEFSKSELISLLNLNPDRVSVIPNGAEHFRVNDTKVPISNFVTVLGSLTPRKNLEIIVPALASAGYVVKVVGVSGESRVFGNRQIPQSWNSKNIQLLGRLTDEELFNTLRGGIALVFPSIYEGFGLPIVEAQAAGTAVITSNSSSLPEVAGEGALFFEPADFNNAIEHVSYLQSHPEFREILIEKGKQNLARFSWDESAKKLSKTLDDLK